MSIDNETRVMAIDYGIKRLGIALSDSLKMFAYPHKTINNDSLTFSEIQKIIQEKKIINIVLGLPNEVRPTATSIVKNVHEFKEKLEQKFKLNVILWDESYTSTIAQQRIIESVNKKSKRQNKGLLDMHSAAVFLQEYLDSIKKVN